MDIKQIVFDSYEKELKYSHDCWGSSTVDEQYILNYEKLRENILNECFKIFNQQLQDLNNMDLNEQLISRKIIHESKQLFKRNFK